jgi:hypothetical protein
MLSFSPDSPMVDLVIPAKCWKPIVPPVKKLGSFLHVTVNSPDTLASAVANVFKNCDPSRPASTQYIVGKLQAKDGGRKVGVVQCVPEAAQPCAAPGANKSRIHIELVGEVTMTWGQWIDSGVPQVAAELFVDIHVRNKWSVTLLDAEGLLDEREGIATHWDGSAAIDLAHKRNLTSSSYFTKNSGHHDPYATIRGPAANIDQFDMVAMYGLILNALPSGYADMIREST